MNGRTALHGIIEVAEKKDPKMLSFSELFSSQELADAAQSAERLHTYLNKIKLDLQKLSAEGNSIYPRLMKQVEDYQSQYIESEKRFQSILKEIEFQSYSQAASRPQGFFLVWKSFLETLRVAKAWLRDHNLPKPKAEPKLLKATLLNSVKQRGLTFPMHKIVQSLRNSNEVYKAIYESAPPTEWDAEDDI